MRNDDVSPSMMIMTSNTNTSDTNAHLLMTPPLQQQYPQNNTTVTDKDVVVVTVQQPQHYPAVHAVLGSFTSSTSPIHLPLILATALYGLLGLFALKEMCRTMRGQRPPAPPPPPPPPQQTGFGTTDEEFQRISRSSNNTRDMLVHSHDMDDTKPTYSGAGTGGSVVSIGEQTRRLFYRWILIAIATRLLMLPVQAYNYLPSTYFSNNDIQLHQQHHTTNGTDSTTTEENDLYYPHINPINGMCLPSSPGCIVSRTLPDYCFATSFCVLVLFFAQTIQAARGGGGGGRGRRLSGRRGDVHPYHHQQHSYYRTRSMGGLGDGGRGGRSQRNNHNHHNYHNNHQQQHNINTNYQPVHNYNASSNPPSPLPPSPSIRMWFLSYCDEWSGWGARGGGQQNQCWYCCCGGRCAGGGWAHPHNLSDLNRVLYGFYFGLLFLTDIIPILPRGTFLYGAWISLAVIYGILFGLMVTFGPRLWGLLGVVSSISSNGSNNSSGGGGGDGGAMVAESKKRLKGLASKLVVVCVVSCAALLASSIVYAWEISEIGSDGGDANGRWWTWWWRWPHVLWKGRWGICSSSSASVWCSHFGRDIIATILLEVLPTFLMLYIMHSPKNNNDQSTTTTKRIESGSVEEGGVGVGGDVIPNTSTSSMSPMQQQQQQLLPIQQQQQQHQDLSSGVASGGGVTRSISVGIPTQQRYTKGMTRASSVSGTGATATSTIASGNNIRTESASLLEKSMGASYGATLNMGGG